MPTIKHIQTGEEITVSEFPRYIAGTWECGSERFTDPARDQYIPVAESTIVSPVEFKLLWLPQERLAIKTMRLTDPVVDDFYELLEDTRLTEVNLSLSSTQQAVDYLLGKLIHAEIITADKIETRRAAILSGQFN